MAGRSAAVDGLESSIAVSGWDLYHLMGGAAFTFWGNDITLGVGYSWGEDQVSRNPNLQSSGGPANIPFERTRATIQYRQLKFIVGFAFGATQDQSDS